ncbi:MAG: ISL3 family transposase [Planctomycetes bacterium]|nr:ISL3 family transposase [Planctomycetota bacterium]
MFRSVKHAVEWGLAHRDLSGIEAIGVDEIQWRSGHTYLTLVYQIDGAKRLLWVAQERTEQSLRGFFTSLTAEVRSGIRFVCSDMWRQYLNVIAEQIPAALHVLDRFHIMRNMNMALDDVRRAEVAQLQRDGYEPILTKARWCLLKRPENLTDHQEVRLKEILQYNLKSVRAHLLREDFQRFWEYTSPEWAMKFLDAWCTRTMRSRIVPMKKIARSLRRHRHLILNWFRARGTISSGVVEGFNGKAKLTTRKAFGFRTPKGIEIALFHVLGRLPEPAFTHRFCRGGGEKGGEHVPGHEQRPAPAVEGRAERLVLDLDADRTVVAHAGQLPHEPRPVDLAVAGNPRGVPPVGEVEPADLVHGRLVEPHVLGVHVE